MPIPNQKMFGPQHHNAIAKDIRESLQLIHDTLPDGEVGNKPMRIACMRSVCEVATKLAKRFTVDNENFNPIKFLDQCSPDTEMYPLSELWDN